MQCLSKQPNCRLGRPPLYCSQARVGRERNKMFNAMAVEPVAHPNPYSALIGLQPNVVAAEGEAVHDRTDIHCRSTCWDICPSGIGSDGRRMWPGRFGSTGLQLGVKNG